jgi:hypothetical protein
MTRERYKKAVEQFFNVEFIKRTTFPMLLVKAAEHLFIVGETDSVIAMETRRRLLQLNETGYTDD